jgi:hypothetical protein
LWPNDQRNRAAAVDIDFKFCVIRRSGSRDCSVANLHDSKCWREESNLISAVRQATTYPIVSNPCAVEATPNHWHQQQSCHNTHHFAQHLHDTLLKSKVFGHKRTSPLRQHTDWNGDTPPHGDFKGKLQVNL